jgi:hypothetical protein
VRCGEQTAPPADYAAAESVIGAIIDQTHPDFSDESSGFRAEARAILAAIRRGEVPGVYAEDAVKQEQAAMYGVESPLTFDHAKESNAQGQPAATEPAQHDRRGPLGCADLLDAKPSTGERAV